MIINLDKAAVGLPLDLDPSATCSAYDDFISDWTKCRDAVAGQKAIKAKGVTYLPMLNGHENDPKEYSKYLQRAQWFGATGRTLEGLMGMLFRKAPVVTTMNKEGIPEQINDENTTKLINKAFSRLSTDGKGLNGTIRAFTEEVIKVNRVGALVDFPYTEEDLQNLGINSQYDYEKALLYPQIAMYKAESIINWDWVKTPTGTVPYLYVLKETISAFNGKTMVPDDVIQYRILYLENANGPIEGRKYKQIITQQKQIMNDKGQNITIDMVDKVIYPKKDGKELTFIPFFPLTDMGIDYKEIRESMINDLADVNIGHYMNSADWENELHWVGVPTACFPGWNSDEMGQPYIGKALAVPEGTKPSILKASSDSGLKDEMAVKREQMAVLGAERLSQKGRYVASASTSKINSSSDSATLSTTATVLSEAFTEILNFLLDWAGEEKRINITINTDFYQDELSGSELLDWVQALQQGGISYSTFYYNMVKKEAFPAAWTEDREKLALEETINAGLGDGSFDSVVAELNTLKRQLADLTGQGFRQFDDATTVSKGTENLDSNKTEELSNADTE